MRSKLACLVVVLAAVACGESRERVGSNHPDGAPGGGGALGSSPGGTIATSDSAGGGTAVASSTTLAGGASAGGTVSPGGSLATSSASGGTGGAGGLAGTATGGRGGSAGTTIPSGGSTPSPDAGAGTGGKPQLDGGTPGLDASAQPDAPLPTNPDAAGITDNRRADSSADGGAIQCHTTSTGCMCTAIPSTEPSVSVCNNENQDEARLNRCCAGSAYCVCDVFACATETSSGRCQCDFQAFLSKLPPTWTGATQCPKPAAGFKCCLRSQESYCTCKQQECTDGSTEVANCELSQLDTCSTSEMSVDSCN